jgi:spermidine/putrescine transport system permease protein
VARKRRPAGETTGVWYPRWYWPGLSAPGAAWLLLLFLAPLYVVLAISFGTVDPLFQEPVPVWNPLRWNSAAFIDIAHKLFGANAFLLPAFERTLIYVAAATVICLAVGYPVAYFVARYGGRQKGLLLVLLIAPFWVSYMMRMLAWVNLLGGQGWVNQTLQMLQVFNHPVNWLNGNPVTVVLGLVYGYIPYMILPLFAGLDRIDPALLEVARDLGAGRARTFLRVTLPMSKQAILAGMVIVTLPMFGDYFTNDLLSGSPSTSMIGNLIDDSVLTPGQATEAAALVVILTALLVAPMLYYLRSTSKALEEQL